MARVDFYHLTRDPAPVVVARLAGKVIAGGGGLAVIAADAPARKAIDDALWSAVPDSFLPHAPADAPASEMAGDPIAILAGLDAGVPDGLTTAALADGEWRDAALAFARTLFLFDGQRIDDARAAWRQLGNRADVDRHYWRQDGQGRWTEGP